ncbi:DUF5709 domain-containing protein [Actinomadura kijaniata]|uniref:DUF5709 domain-containing protein n=1 Tax=Actinomadura kijaniata TaxID=46161 RepID=UPI003F1B5C08
MTEYEPERRATTPEDDGIPDLQDGTPQQQWAEDPQRMVLPGDRSMTLDEYGTTVEEMRQGEPLSRRLEREEPEVPIPPNEPIEPAGRIVEDNEGIGPDTEKDAVARETADESGFTAEESAMHIERE